MLSDHFGALDTLKTSHGDYAMYRLDRLEAEGLVQLDHLPFSIRVMLEAVLRQVDGVAINPQDVVNLAGWQPRVAERPILPFRPARVVMQDFTGVPAVVDLAAMRSAIARLGGDPAKINPVVPVDLVIDHSVQVDSFGCAAAFSLNVAMEFFNETQQPVLDHYLAASTTETEFLKDVGWDKNWAYAYHFYRPLLTMTKEKGRKILAINAPNTIVRKVARSGLSSLAPNERNQLASHINLKNENHRKYLYQMFEKHPHQNLKRFDFFYQAQCVWEDTMAENISKYLSKTKEKLVVLTGNGHIVNKYGIPNRTLNRIKIPMVTILLQPLTGPLTLKRKMADYIWLTGECSW